MSRLKIQNTVAIVQLFFLFGIFSLSCNDNDPPRIYSDDDNDDTDVDHQTDTDGEAETDPVAVEESEINVIGDSVVTLRADYLKLHKPTLWTPGPSGPMAPEISNKADITLANGLVRDTSPKDGYYDISLLVRFDTLDPKNNSGNAVFSSGLCPINGGACAFDPDAEQQVGEYEKKADEPCSESDSVLPPCIENQPVDTTMVLGELGRIELKRATMAASFKNKVWMGVKGGVIRGFVTEEAAKRIEIKNDMLGFDMEFKLYNMLKDKDSEIVNGKKGWWFIYSFEASPVDFTE